ncbi:MAG: hypothetical protein ACQETH_16840, partial [Candidatus Rifleibacteriota bacterium]
NNQSCFKSCPACDFKWATREEFLNDENISLVGYQVNFEMLKEGLFLFNHKKWATMALEVKEFTDLYDGPVFEVKAAGTRECPEYCLHRDNLNPCPAICECAFVREIIQILKNKYNK